MKPQNSGRRKKQISGAHWPGIPVNVASSKPMRESVSKRQNEECLRNNIQGCILSPPHTHTHATTHLHAHRLTSPTIESKLVTRFVLFNTEIEPSLRGLVLGGVSTQMLTLLSALGIPQVRQCKQDSVTWLHNQPCAVVCSPPSQEPDNCSI